MAKIGDIYYIDTSNGRSYFQYIRDVPKYSWMIRVFSGFYKEHDCKKKKDINKIAQSPVQFITFFPLITAERGKFVHKCGNVPLDEEAKKMPIFRYGIPDPRTKKVPVWCFWDGEKEWAVENITDEQRKLPIKWVVNYDSFVSMIEEEWRPEKNTW